MDFLSNLYFKLKQQYLEEIFNDVHHNVPWFFYEIISWFSSQDRCPLQLWPHNDQISIFLLKSSVPDKLQSSGEDTHHSHLKASINLDPEGEWLGVGQFIVIWPDTSQEGISSYLVGLTMEEQVVIVFHSTTVESAEGWCIRAQMVDSLIAW